MATQRPAAGGIKSVLKVLDVLECLAAARQPVGTSEIARAVGFHVSTTHRLLRTLAARGYVEQDAVLKSFALGPRLAALGGAYSGDGLTDAARPELEALRDAFSETITLAVYRDYAAIEVAAAGGLQRVRVSFDTGHSYPAHCSALGKVLLAGLGPEAFAEFLARAPLTRHTPNTITRKRALATEITLTRRRDFAIDDEELAADLCCVAVPVTNRAGRVVAALTIGMPKSRYRAARLPEWVAALKASAARIGDRLRPGGI